MSLSCQFGGCRRPFLRLTWVWDFFYDMQENELGFVFLPHRNRILQSPVLRVRRNPYRPESGLSGEHNDPFRQPYRVARRLSYGQYWAAILAHDPISCRAKYQAVKPATTVDSHDNHV
jgi:hypothetical protein